MSYPFEVPAPSQKPSSPAALRAVAGVAAPTSPLRIPMNTFGIAFGLAGLADTWSLATGTLGAPAAVAVTLWVLTTVAWVWLVVAHAVRGRRSAERLVDQLRNPAQGPIAALVPIVGMLIGAEVYEFLPALGVGLMVAFIVVAALFAGWLLAQWSRGLLHIEDVHGGYFLPTAAGGFIAATSAGTIGLHGLGLGAFAVSVFFWVVVGALILTRITLKGQLPAPLVPTLAIYIAPPAVGGIAWFSLNGGHADPVAYSLAGLTVVLALMQIGLIPAYRQLTFSTGFWSFTFPFAAVARQAIDWLDIERPALWQLWAWLVVAAITVFIAAIGIRWLFSTRPASAGPTGTNTTHDTGRDDHERSRSTRCWTATAAGSGGTNHVPVGAVNGVWRPTPRADLPSPSRRSRSRPAV